MTELDLSKMDSEQIESKAREQGWKPESEWKGDPPPRGFVSAEEFLEANNTSLPLLSKRLHKLEDELEQTKAENTKIKSGMRRYKAMNDKALAAERRKRDEAVDALQKERAQAITDSDGEKVIETERKIAQLQNEPLGDDGPEPFAEEWLTENAWYETDAEMQAVADGISNRIRQERPELQGRAHLDELSTRVKQAMPHKFKNPKRNDPPPVEPGRRTPPSKGQTFDDLPQEAKDAYYDFKSMFEADGMEYTKKQYLANYEWEE